MTSPEPVTIRVLQIPADRDALYAGPKTVLCSSSGKLTEEECKITAGEMQDIIASIRADSKDAEAMSNLMVMIIKSVARGDETAPEDGGETGLIIKKHTPEHLWPSVHCFWSKTNGAIMWRVAEDSAQIKELLDRNFFKLELIEKTHRPFIPPLDLQKF